CHSGGWAIWSYRIRNGPGKEKPSYWWRANRGGCCSRTNYDLRITNYGGLLGEAHTGGAGWYAMPHLPSGCLADHPVVTADREGRGGAESPQCPSLTQVAPLQSHASSSRTSSLRARVSKRCTTSASRK